jgi:hypothetical protein
MVIPVLLKVEPLRVKPSLLTESSRPGVRVHQWRPGRTHHDLPGRGGSLTPAHGEHFHPALCHAIAGRARERHPFRAAFIPINGGRFIVIVGGRASRLPQNFRSFVSNGGRASTITPEPGITRSLP